MSEPFIQTYTGKKIYFLNPDPDSIDIEDIAHALSLLCRYGGHCKEFYSVAQHSVLCAKEAPEKLKLEALLHDASEAYLVDIPRPIKRQLPQYQVVEANLELAVAKRFNLNWPFHKDVKHIDSKMLATEAVSLMNNSEGFDGLPEPYSFKVVPWTWQEAKYNFLGMFKELT